MNWHKYWVQVSWDFDVCLSPKRCQTMLWCRKLDCAHWADHPKQTSNPTILRLHIVCFPALSMQMGWAYGALAISYELPPISPDRFWTSEIKVNLSRAEMGKTCLNIVPRITFEGSVCGQVIAQLHVLPPVNQVSWFLIPMKLCGRTTWIPWNLSFRYIHCTGQFTPKMKANA